ncbi:formate acetyltransferase [bacterium]|nr:formate acetyltransferase [bacterium]
MLNSATFLFLRFMAVQFNRRPALRKKMKSADGWINFSVGFKTHSGSVQQAIIFHDGHVNVSKDIPEDVDILLQFYKNSVLWEMLSSTPNEMLNLVLKNKMILDGNLACLQLFSYYVSLVFGSLHQTMLNISHKKDIRSRRKTYCVETKGLPSELAARSQYRMKGELNSDGAVKGLTDPFLVQFSIEDFPRLKEFYHSHFDTIPEVCAERPGLMTDWFRENGFEMKKNGEPWCPELRQAFAFKYLMENKRPIIRKNDLIAGTTTAKEIGLTVFPDGHATMFWGELQSVDKRVLSPYRCTAETAEILHRDIFPFWIKRNFRERVRQEFDYSLGQKLDERFVAYFVWKTVGISHTIPNFKCLLTSGTAGLRKEIQERLTDDNLNDSQRDSLQSMAICLEGVEAYAINLSIEANKQAEIETNGTRKKELNRISQICAKVPALPATTLDEAIHATWILWIALHNENANTGLSLGRLDQLLQPYFEHDIALLNSEQKKSDYIRSTIEIVGCLLLRLSDHQPLTPDVSNYLFGGASSTQAITIGGVTEDGEDAVNDMTYIFLKAVEIVPVRDTNINARYSLDKNSDNYLKRLCEVNIITSATPIMQSDQAVSQSLKQHGYSQAEINDWAATGCVEPTIQGKHFGHTGSILMNLVAAMEMALNDGYHPVMRWDVGPKTGRIEAGDFKDFDRFFDAWAEQQRFVISQAVSFNNMLGKIHQELRPTPLLSASIDGCIEKGKDVVHGGARFNSSGTSNIGLADVTDSLLVIKQLVFEGKKVSFKELKRAIDMDFADNPVLHAMVQNKVKLFGSGSDEALKMADRVAKVIHDCYRHHQNYRGGCYTTGFWSMSQHVAYGSLSGTLPSGRLAGKAFTPGLTPSPYSSTNLLDNMSAVARLNPEYMDNNIAFNVKLTPSQNDSRETTVDNMFAYVKSYFQQGGMQMQFNVVTSEMLKDAMANPENYRNLMVRISGYNAYFVELNKEIQVELIERAEYKI